MCCGGCSIFYLVNGDGGIEIEVDSKQRRRWR